jgi:hypothetical protein
MNADQPGKTDDDVQAGAGREQRGCHFRHLTPAEGRAQTRLRKRTAELSLRRTCEKPGKPLRPREGTESTCFISSAAGELLKYETIHIGLSELAPAAYRLAGNFCWRIRTQTSAPADELVLSLKQRADMAPQR